MNFFKGAFWFLLGSFVGFLSTKCIELAPFRLEKELNVVSIADLIISVVIVFLFYIFFDKIKETKSNEKGLISSRLEYLQDELKSNSNSIRNERIKYSVLAARNKSFIVSINKLKEIIGFTSIKCPNDEIDKIIQSARVLKDLQTNSPITNETSEDDEDSPIIIDDGIVSFSETRIQEIENQYETILTEVLKLRIVIIKT
jgi:hypothetical protein